MIVEQAVYGEVKGGHGLRSATGYAALAAELASRLDLPDNAPPGVGWSPFLSGFPHRGFYVIARTFRDPNAARAGMVLSHALVARLDDVASFPDLRPLLDHLISEPLAPATLATLEIGPNGQEAPSSPELHAAAAALVTRGSGPVVHLGHCGFEALVAAVWWRLWPAARRGFGFRLSFGPGDLVEAPCPALVCTPLSLVARWQGHRLVDRSVTEGAPLVSAMLTGDAAGGPVREFADSIGADLASFADLPLLEQAYRLARLEPDALGTTVAALRLVERLSPDSTRGSVGKDNLIVRLLVQFESASASDILRLRNLTVGAFPGARRIWDGLVRWVAENSFPRASDADFRTACNDAFEVGKASDEWCRAVLDGIRGAARRLPGPVFPALWRWANEDTASIGPLWAHLRSGSGFEDGLVQAAPTKLRLDAAQTIVRYAAKEALYRLHGVAVAAVYDPIEAAKLQVAVEPPPEGDGLRLALARAEPLQVVAAAIEIGDTRIVALAAVAVSRRPELLAAIDLANETARSVWAAALGRNPEAWRGPSDPRAAFYQLLDDLLDGRSVPGDLVANLAETPLGDLGEYPRRPELWAKLTGAARERLLRATVAGWLTKAAAGHAVPPAEPVVRDFIVADRGLDAVLESLSYGRIAQAVQIVAALPTFEESRFRQWLGGAIERTPTMLPTHAEAVGQITDHRRWHGVADDLLRFLRSGRADVRPALRTCISLVGFFDRWMNALTQVTSADKWNSLLELSAELYPTGPEQEGLWERAGGRDGDLSWGVSGRSRWSDALGQVRRGKGLRVDKLLREMQRDFPANARLRFLAGDTEFDGN